MHAVVGCGAGAAVDAGCMAGAIGAGLQELGSPILDDLSQDPETRSRPPALPEPPSPCSPVVTQKPSTCQPSRSNRKNHEQGIAPHSGLQLALLTRGKTDEERRAYEDAALFLRNGADGLDSPLLEERVARGALETAKQQELIATGVYGYTEEDAKIDFYTRNRHAFHALYGIAKVGAGVAKQADRWLPGPK